MLLESTMLIYFERKVSYMKFDESAQKDNNVMKTYLYALLKNGSSLFCMYYTIFILPVMLQLIN